MKSFTLFVLLFFTYAAHAEDVVSKSIPAGVATYDEFGMPPLPEDIEPINAPLLLTAIKIATKACTDHSGDGVRKFVNKGKQPNRYSAGSLTVRDSKPRIKRKLTFYDGSPAYLTVASFRDNCIKYKSEVEYIREATEDQLPVLSEMQKLMKRIDELEKRIEVLEKR